MKIYQIDAFAGEVFKGNPAAVVPLEAWLDESVMQAIAAENNLSETAFFCPVSDGEGGEDGADFRLRWFTPRAEIELCGHATLATAHTLWTELGFAGDVVRFSSVSGPLAVRRDGSLLELDFPAYERTDEAVSETLVGALGLAPEAVFDARGFLIAVYDNKRQVHELKPDFAKVSALHPKIIGVTAPAAGHDYVCRLFAPSHGINEDPATGSLQCALAPYWGERLGKTSLTAHQVSERGAEFVCEVEGDRVKIGGRAVTYMKGEIVGVAGV